MIEVDIIVVGAGSAGCAVAGRLSEDATRSVLLLEAGTSDFSPVIMAPAATDLYGIGNPRWDWRYRAEGDPSRLGRTDMWPRGKALGGSSSINGTVYLRGDPTDFDGWAAAGNRGWSYAEVLPYFRRSETNENGADAYRGGDGPVRVSNLRSVHPTTRAFVEGAIEVGLKPNRDLNGATCEGVGYNQATQRRGWRHSSARAYLGPAKRRRNLRVVTRAHVTSLLFEGRRATGVRYRRGDEVVEARARAEVVLCAGVIASPQLLMSSGVGPAAHLRDIGVDVVHDLPGVGQNLLDHCGPWMPYEVRVPTYNNEKSLMRQALQGLNWLAFGRGPATAPGCQATAFVRTREGERKPDAQIYFTSVGFEFTPNALQLYDESAVTVTPHVSRPRSRGQVKLRSADMREKPRILPNLLGDKDDVRRLIDACRLVRRIVTSSKAFGSLVVRELGPLREVGDGGDWDGFVRANSVPIYQCVGTCKMGQDDGAVVDETLKVRGLEGLRVADASIIPGQASGCTNALAIMIGEKASDMIRQGARR